MYRLDHARARAALMVAAAFGAFIPVCAQAQVPSAPTPVSATGNPASSAAPSAQFPPLEVADTLMFHKRYQEAIAKFASIEPKTASIWNKMGIAYQMMYNQADAARCYKESLKLNPDDADVLNNLGTLFESQLDHKHAEKMYRRAVHVDPQFALGFKNLATTLMEEHKYKQGREADARALALDPAIFAPGNYLTVDNTASAHDRGAMNYYMAIDCARAGQTACALEHLRMALNQGYTSASKVAADSNFAALAGDPAFQQLLAEQSVKRQ
jgi:Tfp pilus assembly protein PilF